MPQSPLRLIMRCSEFLPRGRIRDLPKNRRGIYVLYQYDSSSKKYDVVYVGMATGSGIRGRLTAHDKSLRKAVLWTHFSAFEVWDNIRNDEIAELEGLFRHIYRKDAQANRLNVRRVFKKLIDITKDLKCWK